MRVKCNKCKTTYVSTKYLKDGVCKICISREEDERELKRLRNAKKSKSWVEKKI